MISSSAPNVARTELDKTSKCSAHSSNVSPLLDDAAAPGASKESEPLLVKQMMLVLDRDSRR
jgi:hypothetical protein